MNDNLSCFTGEIPSCICQTRLLISALLIHFMRIWSLLEWCVTTVSWVNFKAHVNNKPYLYLISIKAQTGRLFIGTCCWLLVALKGKNHKHSAQSTMIQLRYNFIKTSTILRSAAPDSKPILRSAAVYPWLQPHWPWGSCMTPVLRPETRSPNRYSLTG